MSRHLVEHGWGDLAGKLKIWRRSQLRRVDVEPVVVSPHNGKLHIPAICSVEIALFESCFQEWAVVILVLSEDESRDRGTIGCSNLFSEDFWIELVLVAPERQLGLFVV